MPKISAGLAMFRVREGRVEVLLVHPGGPFWKGRDSGAWTIPKGKVEEGEALLETAKREFEEETGFKPRGPFLPLTTIRQKAGKIVHAWAFEGDADPGELRSKVTKMQWPPRSGRWRSYPEVDEAGWFRLEEGRTRINPAQVSFLEEIEELARERGGGRGGVEDGRGE